jgi:hypothetical protein
MVTRDCLTIPTRLPVARRPSVEGRREELNLDSALARRSREAVEGKMGSYLGDRAPA